MKSFPLRLVPRNAWDLLAFGVVGAFLLLILATWSDYGIGWDEEFQRTYGDYVLRWYRSGFQDRSAMEFHNLRYYGGLFEALAQLSWRLLPGGVYEVRHLVIALSGLGAVVGAYRLSRYLGGPGAGPVGALFLLLTPVFYGHSFINSKDIPFATFYLFSTYYIVRSIRHLPEIPRGLTVKLGTCIGLALSIRVGGILLIGFLLGAFAIWYLDARARREPGEVPNFPRATAAFGPRFLAAFCIAYLVMLLGWPWAQLNPILHPLEALRESARFPWDGPVLFEGQHIRASELPWYYLPKWMLISLPEFLLLGLIIGLPLGVGALRLHRRGEAAARRGALGGGTSRREGPGGDAGSGMADAPPNRTGRTALAEHLSLLLCILFPIVYAVVSDAVLYDGLRHFLFVLPLIAVVSALGFVRLVRTARRIVVVPVAAVAVASAFVTALDMAQLHPYQYIYFNRLFAGGLPGAAGRYETEYWGTSYKEGAEWIVANHPASADGSRPRVASCSWPASTSYFLPEDRFEYVGSIDFGISDQPDLVLATTRFDCHRRMEGRLLHVIERQGVPILHITELPVQNPPTEGNSNGTAPGDSRGVR